MLEILKDILGREFEMLKKEIDTKGKTVVDISTKFLELFSRNIIQITLGEDISNDMIEIQKRQSSGGLKNEKVKFYEAINECLEQLVASFIPKKLNPLHLLGFISMKPNLTPY